QAGRLDGGKRVECADRARLHVAGAATVHPAVLDDRRERRRLPHVERACRHHVAVALQDQRLSRVGRRPVSSDHAARPGKIVRDRAVAAQIPEVLEIEMPVVDLIAALAQEITDHVLARPFRTARRGDGDEVGGSRKLRVKAGIDGVEDPLLGIGVHWLYFSSAAELSQDQSTSAPILWRPPDLSESQTCPYNSSQPMWRSRMADNRVSDNKNVLYLIIGVLVVAVAVLGFNLYQAKKQPEGLQINVG